ncbi:MAG: hypothetical protein B7Z55_08265 [Planctomycetales bacterium 12-60-4]|nr:MAG: hypothetical protein B7Z55_08265 [Planctomycetales bacterium 12-60-4]
MELRRQAEAVEAQGEAAPATAAKPKRATATKAKRTKEKPVARKRLIWVLYNGSMKEEGRFPYDQRAAAEEKLELLRSKSKKLYFIHPVKEVIGDPSATVGLAAAAAAAKLAAIAIPEIPDEVEEEVLPDVEAEMDEGADDDDDDDGDDAGDGEE